MRDLGFAFNDKDFSDRILHLYVVAASLDFKSDAKGSDPDCVTKPKTKKSKKKQKRRLKGNGDAADDNNSECSSDVKVKTLHICSAILAGSSPFFYKLFKNGMRQSKSRVVILSINTSEEAALMDLLKFTYSNTLSATSATDLADVLIAADKFEVTCCMSYCIEMLLKLPMSLEHALFYLELPSSLLTSEIVTPLIDAAKKYVAAHYKDFTKSQEDAMELPLSAIEVVLGSEGLQVTSEDDVYDFILEWARAHYPELEERREILTKRLVKNICFQNMSSSKLKEVLVCPDFDHEQVSKLVMEALFSKVELSCRHHINDSKDLATTNCNFSGRVYNPHCVVYFDLRKDECADLFPSKHIDSPHFSLSGKRLYLSAYCGQKEDHFGLYLNREAGSETCTLDFELAVMNKSLKEFESKLKVNNHTFEDLGWGLPNLLGIPWTKFMSDDSDYFIDGILLIRAEISLVNNSKP